MRSDTLRADQLERAVEDHGPLTHRLHPEVAGTRQRRVKAAAVIGDQQQHLSSVNLEHDVDAIGVGVFDDVVQMPYGIAIGRAEDGACRSRVPCWFRRSPCGTGAGGVGAGRFGSGAVPAAAGRPAPATSETTRCAPRARYAAEPKLPRFAGARRRRLLRLPFRLPFHDADARPERRPTRHRTHRGTPPEAPRSLPAAPRTAATATARTTAKNSLRRDEMLMDGLVSMRRAPRPSHQLGPFQAAVARQAPIGPTYLAFAFALFDYSAPMDSK